MGTITVNGTELHHEVRGRGPALLFIPGATGDAGWFSEVTDPLAGEFTVVSYDRRGNSRSPRPAGWTATTIGEQADDAAALLRALDLAPATVFGTSFGGVITLELVGRHPETVRRAFVHEPPIVAPLPNAAEIMAGLGTIIAETMPVGGPPAVVEHLLRAVARVPFDDVDPALRERVLGNGEVLLSVELPTVGSYVPDIAALTATGVPIHALAGVESRGAFDHDAAAWLAAGLGTELTEMPGGHVPYVTHPSALVDLLRSRTATARPPA